MEFLDEQTLKHAIQGRQRGILAWAHQSGAAPQRIYGRGFHGEYLPSNRMDAIRRSRKSLLLGWRNLLQEVMIC